MSSDDTGIAAIASLNRGRLTRLVCKRCEADLLRDGIFTDDDAIEALVLHATKTHGRRFPLRVAHCMSPGTHDEMRFWIEPREIEH